MICIGIPGAGKTIISAIVIDHLQRSLQDDTTAGLAYIYFNYQSSHEQTYEMVLASLLRQLLKVCTDLPEEIFALYEHHNKTTTRPLAEELRESLRATVRFLPRTFIVLDALDEYYASNATGFHALINDIFDALALSTTSVIATSRPISEITSCFEGCILKEIRAHECDIEAYVDHRMHEILSGRITGNSRMQSLVKSEVLNATDGM
jgi:Cdc6-like AAA superfamily ATPase